MKHPQNPSGAVIAFLALLSAAAFFVPDSHALSGVKIGLDPGHGAGHNPGVVIAEGTWVLDAGFRARTHLQNHGAQVVMTRTTGANPSLSTRVNIANSNNVNRFVSIHSNAAGSSAHGIEALWCNQNPFPSSSKTLADRLRIRALNLVHNNNSNRGTKECLDVGRGFHFFVIRGTVNMPASLPEYYFHTNSWENNNIHNTAAGRENVGKSLYAAICDIYGVTPNFEAPPPPPPPPSIGPGGIVVDNDDPGFEASSAWGTATWASDKHGADYRFRDTEAVSDAATWNFTVENRGNYEVFAWWTAAPNRATSAGYLIDHANGTTTVNANQTQNGGKWNSLGTFLFGGSSPTSHSVRLSCWTTSGDIVIADAIRLVPRSVWVDNHHTGFNATSNWGIATWASDKFGPDYRFRDTEPISDPATWTVQHLTEGSHRVDAWWTAASNRATAAAYHVHRSGGTTTVNVNQTQNGGKWNSLGTFNLDQGTNSVQLSCWTSSGDIVIADAVRWVLP